MSKLRTLKIILYCLLIIIIGSTTASSSEPLPESDHPYANSFEKTWTINKPGVDQIRLHFENIELNSNDFLYVLDKYDNVLETHSLSWDLSSQSNADRNFWTDWYTGDTLKVRLVTDDSITGYGFKIDDIDTRSSVNRSSDSLPESDHPYANNYKNTWTIEKPGADQIRLHFENIEISNDYLYILDKYDNVLETYSWRPTAQRDLWTDWYTGDTLKVNFATDSSGTDYGFKIDNLETRLNKTRSPSENTDNSKPTEAIEIQSNDKNEGGTSSDTKQTSSFRGSQIRILT
jgi:hypothetical protein